MDEAPWRVAGTSVAGERHARRGGACQDRHRVEFGAHGAMLAIVSDGAGSATYGGEGAALLCDAFADRFHELVANADAIERTSLPEACFAVRDAVKAARASARQEAELRGTTIDAFHATLVGAAVLPGRGGIFFHIGDGAALATGEGGKRWLLSPPMNGEYADTTFFFTESDWRRRLRFAPIGPEYDTIFLMSDGVTEVALSQKEGGPKPFMGFFEPIGRYLAGTSREDGELALQVTLDGEAVRARSDDDKTLVWASLGAAA